MVSSGKNVSVADSGGTVAGSPMKFSESYGKTVHVVSHSGLIWVMSFCRLACKENVVKVV